MPLPHIERGIKLSMDLPYPPSITPSFPLIISLNLNQNDYPELGACRLLSIKFSWSILTLARTPVLSDPLATRKLLKTMRLSLR
jgi:hypothetical protein